MAGQVGDDAQVDVQAVALSRLDLALPNIERDLGYETTQFTAGVEPVVPGLWQEPGATTRGAV